MKHTNTLTAILVGFTLFAGVGCEKEGPMEQAGEEIDRATTDMGNAVEDACEDATDKNC